MEKDNFKVSADLLQKNAAKASIRDLNAEFQRMGGKVIYKTSKKGPVYLLSHPDPKYLEEFRIRLFGELGLLKEKDISKDEKKPKAEAPRYGDKHRMRRGWNVRSPKEFSEGRYDQDDQTPPEGETDDRAPPQRGYDNGRKDMSPQNAKGRPRSGPREDRTYPYSDRERRFPHQRDTRKPEPTKGPSEEPREKSGGGAEGTKTFEERWENLDEFLDIIEGALENGAVDDGQIIKYAYKQKVSEEKIKELKKLLWDNRCRGRRDNCPHGKKKFRFEDLMKVSSGKMEGWENIDSPLIEFLPLWEKNMEEMYGQFRDKDVIVEGKVSSYKPVYRKGHEHLKILVYDTLVKEAGDKGDPKETRKLWVKVTLKEFHSLTGDEKVHLDDMVRFQGKCVLDNYFNDYWVIDLKDLKVLESSDGEVISAPPP